MLERILEVQGIGLLHEANGKKYTCKKATLIYSDNARGKTTLASILRSVASGDASIIRERKTVDGMLEPKVVLNFGSGHPVIFKDEGWSESRPEILVFDTNFIERNVHSGGTVNTGQRKNLLEFALGEAAVIARIELEKAMSKAKIASEQLQNCMAQLSGYHTGMSIDQFEKLPELDNIEMKIDELQKRINASKSQSVILNKAVPIVIAEPIFDIDVFFAKWAITLEDVHESTERLIKEHIVKLAHKNAEHWLSEGQQFNDSETCPYCGEETSKNNLIRAYRTHFNVAYNDLKAQVGNMHNLVIENTGPNVVDDFALKASTAVTHANTWMEHVQTASVKFNVESAHVTLASLRTLMLELSRKKQACPAEAIGTATDKIQAVKLWRTVITFMRDANFMIKAAADAINSYKSSLVTTDMQQMNQQFDILQKTKCRYEAGVVKIIDQKRVFKLDFDIAEKEKKTARECLESIMKSTLDKYERSINELLEKFGASFTIKGMGANFRGSGPRSEYKLQLRGKDIVLENGYPTFTTALSDGDKRTLAFAFFVINTLEDPKLARRIVVIDDPICSLDRNRKHCTIETLKKIHSKSKQIIVFAHDLYFIRDLRNLLLKNEQVSQISIFQLTHNEKLYTDFAELEVDKECESAYFTHHRLLREFVQGNSKDTKSVAKVIRPMLEGYLKHRYAGLIPSGLMFGQIVGLIQEAKPTEPLYHAQNLIEELNEINSYAGQFHHDDSDSVANTINISAIELMAFTKRALSLVYGSFVQGK